MGRNKVMCTKGHFYDSDKYDKCPHCEEGMPAAGVDKFSVDIPSMNVVEQKKRFMPWGREKENEPKIEPKSEIKPEPKSEKVSVQISEKKYQMEETLVDEIKKAKEQALNLDDQKTVGYFSTNQNTEPPVGYLICIAGDDFGKGFPLKSGSNSIGRSQSMDVVITDVKVSREKQAFIIYEPHRREFYLKMGESSGLCYYNGEVLFETVKLQIYDRFELGDTKLMLIPVCSQEFSWDELT